MKKKTIAGLTVIVAIASVVMFAGCVEKEGITPSSPIPTPKTELSLGESAIVDGISFTILEYEFEDSHRYEYEYNRSETVYPAEGAKFLWVHVKAKNVGEVAQNTPSKYYDMDLLYKGTEIRCKSTHSVWGEPMERKMYHGNEKIYPTVSEEGWILYEVPKGIDIFQTKICVEFEEGKTMTWSLAS